jgi:hypothetical protein
MERSPELTRLIEAMTVLRKERLLARHVRTAEKALAKAFTAQGADFLRRLAAHKAAFAVAESLREGTAEEFDPAPLFTQAELATLALFEEPIGKLADAALMAGVRVALAELAADISFDLEHPRAVAFLKGRAAERVTMINGTTRDGLRTLLTQAMEEGWSYGKTAKEIKGRFDGFAGKKPQAHIQSRAHLVAVTEAGEAYEEAGLQVGKELAGMGLEMEHLWLTVGDSRVSDGCLGNQAAGWIPLSQAFPSGHMRPLRFPGCRCTALTRRKPTEK